MVEDDNNIPGELALERDDGMGGWKGMLETLGRQAYANICRHVGQSSHYEYLSKQNLYKIMKHSICYERPSTHWTI